MYTIFVKHKTKMSILKQFSNNFGLLSKTVLKLVNLIDIVDAPHLYSLFLFFYHF